MQKFAKHPNIMFVFRACSIQLQKAHCAKIGSFLEQYTLLKSKGH